MNANKKQTIINVLLTVLCLAVGIGLIVGGSFIKKGNEKKINEWTHVYGTVVGYTTTTDIDDDMYSEIVEYEADGVKYRLKSSSSSNVRPSTGKKREVAYNPANPEEAILVSENRTIIIIMFVAGGVFTAIGALMAVSSGFGLRKKNAPQAMPEPGPTISGQPEQPAQPAGRYVFTGSGAPSPSSEQGGQPDENPFEEFGTKDR